MNIQRTAGYSLAELMIVLSIVGILGSMSYSAYSNYTREADRSRAQANIYEISQKIEREFTQSRSYVSVAEIIGTYTSQFYNYQVESAATTYMITATVTGSRDDFNLRMDNLQQEQRQEVGDSTWIDGWEINN